MKKNDKDLKGKATIILLIILLPLIICGAVLYLVVDAVLWPFRRISYGRSHYYRDLGLKYSQDVTKTPQYRFYNKAVKAGYPVRFPAPEPDGYRYFTYGGTSYVFPDFDVLDRDTDTGVWQILSEDGEKWLPLDTAYERVLSSGVPLPARILVTRDMLMDDKTKDELPSAVVLVKKLSDPVPDIRKE